MTNRSGLERSRSENNDSTPRTSNQRNESETPNNRRLLNALLKLTDHTEKMSKAVENIISKMSLLQSELEKLKISNKNIVDNSIPSMETKLLMSMSELKTEILATKNEKINSEISSSGKQINNAYNFDETLLRVEQLNDLLLKEKRENILSEKCRKIKSQNSLLWNDTLNKRKQAYWNFVKNQKKSDLYNIWRTETPNYLPLKYRPKRIENEITEYTQSRITEAKLKYNNEISIMKAYATHHQQKYNDLDHSMTKIINSLTPYDDERHKLIEMWDNDIRKQEDHSNQVWFKKEKFLKDKKHEDQQNGDSLMSQLSWNEILQQKTNKRKTYNHRQQPPTKNKGPSKFKQVIPKNTYDEKIGNTTKNVAQKNNSQCTRTKNINPSPRHPRFASEYQKEDRTGHSLKNIALHPSTNDSIINNDYLLINKKDFGNTRWHNKKWDQGQSDNSQQPDTENNEVMPTLDIISLLMQENQEPVRDLEYIFSQGQR